MASPQVEHGYTKIANELLEALLRAGLTSREWTVVMTVARDTYGWQDRKDYPVSAWRVHRLTGMGRTKASRAIKGLLERGVLYRNGGGAIGVQKDYDQWVPPRSNSDPGPIRTRGPVRTPKPGPVRTLPPGPIRTPIKQYENKKASGRAADNGHATPAQAFMADAWKLFAAALGQPVERLQKPKVAEWAYAADLVGRLGGESALGLYERFLRRRPRWAQDGGRYDLLALKASEAEVLAAIRDSGVPA